MTVPRRRVLRSQPAPVSIDPRRQQQLHKRREQLVKERTALDRWMARLRRAFHAVEKQQARIGRIERALAKLQDQV